MAREKQKPLKNKKLGFIPSKTPKIAQVIPKKKLNYTKLFEKHYPKRAEPVKKAWIEFAEKNKLNAKDFRSLRPVVDLILKKAGSTYSVECIFSALNFLLRNKNFKSECFPAIETITKNTTGNATRYAFKTLDSLLRNKNFKPECFPAIETITKNTIEYATGNEFKTLDSLLRNKNFKPECFPAIETITKNTIEYATGNEFKTLDSLLRNKNFKPECFPAIEAIAKNTIGGATGEAFNALDSLLINTNFKPNWLSNATTTSLISATNSITKNTTGRATRDAFYTLSSFLINTNFKLEYLPVIETITKNTTGDATGSAVYALNPFLRNTNFKPDWIEKHWNPIFNSIIKNTTGYATEDAFNALNSLLRNKNFKPECFPAIETIAKNTTGRATRDAFNALSSLLKNKNFKPDWIEKYWNPVFNSITKNTTGYATGYAFDALSSLLKNTNLKPEHLNSLLNNEPLFFTILFSTYPASIELGKPLDTLHNNSTKRKQYLNSLTKWQVIALLCSDPEYFYTSSNKMLVERFQSDLKKGEYKINEKIIMTHPFFSYSKDPYLLLKQLTLFDNELGKERIRNLTARLITYDLFTGEKGIFSEKNAGKLINVFTEPIEKLKLEDNYLFLLGNMIERLEKGKNTELIKRKLEENLSKTKWNNRRAFEFLLTAIDKNTNLVSEEKKKEISKLIQERSTFRPQKFVSKGKFTVVQAFGKEGGLWSGTYQGLKRNFKLKETLFQTTPAKGRLNQRMGKIILENDKVRFILIRNEAEEAERILKQTIKENPNGVYIFRGHSYNLTRYFPTKVFEENGAKNILFFPGSCGSSSAIPKYLKNNKSIVNFLANRRIGEAGVSRYIAQEMAKYYSRTTKPIKFSNFLLKRARQLEKRKGSVSSLSYGSVGEILISYLYGR